MAKRVETPSQTSASSLITAEQLASGGYIQAASTSAIRQVAERFSIKLTSDSAGLIDRDDPSDPIARQYIPTLEELAVSAAELVDPVGDCVTQVVPQLFHKYPDRVLLKVAGVCATYCRFCFRRETVGRTDAAINAEDLSRALDYIRSHREVWEVILSGGDPLILSVDRLTAILDELEKIDHVRCLRIHTKVPIVEPRRITSDLLTVLKRRVALWLSVHCNHPRELTPEVRFAIRQLTDIGLPLVSQTVLLRGVNDDPSILEELFRSFVECRIKPYYLHHGDLAKGTRHFRTSLKHGQRIMRALRGKTSGLCLPAYVLDLPGGYGKVPVSTEWVTRDHGNLWKVKDFLGQTHEYLEDYECGVDSGLEEGGLSGLRARPGSDLDR